jgi:Na+/H+ antiporter NhaA
MAKVGILAASVIAGVGGYLLLRVWASRGAPAAPVASDA